MVSMVVYCLDGSMIFEAPEFTFRFDRKAEESASSHYRPAGTGGVWDLRSGVAHNTAADHAGVYSEVSAHDPAASSSLATWGNNIK